jgi:hypothetical protein
MNNFTGTGAKSENELTDTIGAVRAVVTALIAAVPALPQPVHLGAVGRSAMASWGKDAGCIVEVSPSGYCHYAASVHGRLVANHEWRIEDPIPAIVIQHITDGAPMIAKQQVVPDQPKGSILMAAG